MGAVFGLDTSGEGKSYGGCFLYILSTLDSEEGFAIL